MVSRRPIPNPIAKRTYFVSMRCVIIHAKDSTKIKRSRLNFTRIPVLCVMSLVKKMPPIRKFGTRVPCFWKYKYSGAIHLCSAHFRRARCRSSRH